MDWGNLPDDLIEKIMSNYKDGLQERISMRRPPKVDWCSGNTRSYCEVCDRKKKNVLWFRKRFWFVGNFHHNGNWLYSACPSCRHNVPGLYRVRKRVTPEGYFHTYRSWKKTRSSGRRWPTTKSVLISTKIIFLFWCTPVGRGAWFFFLHVGGLK